jgi:hypothetical protein
MKMRAEAGSGIERVPQFYQVSPAMATSVYARMVFGSIDRAHRLPAEFSCHYLHDHVDFRHGRQRQVFVG